MQLLLTIFCQRQIMLDIFEMFENASFCLQEFMGRKFVRLQTWPRHPEYFVSVRVFSRWHVPRVPEANYLGMGQPSR